MALIRFLAFIFGLTAIALLGLAIWFWIDSGHFNIIQLVFVGLGLFQICLVIMLLTAKTSHLRLRCFLLGGIILFLAETVSSIVVFAVGTDIAEQLAPDSKQEINTLNNNLKIVTYFIIGSIVVLVSLMLLVYCYIGSLKNRNFDYDYKFIDQQGNSMTREQKKQRDTQNVQQKYNRKREELQNKYANYKAYRQKQ